MFNFFGAKAGPSINEAAQTAKGNPSIRLFDVRSREEFKEGHIPGSVSLPLDRLDNVQALVLDKNEKIYVYCASGGRSARNSLWPPCAGFAKRARRLRACIVHP